MIYYVPLFVSLSMGSKGQIAQALQLLQRRLDLQLSGIGALGAGRWMAMGNHRPRIKRLKGRPHSWMVDGKMP